MFGFETGGKGRADWKIPLVHNAAVTDSGPTADLTQETFAQVIEVNLRAPIFLTQAALPHMPSGGRIIMISSTSARMANVGSSMPVYSASKAGIEGLVRAWAYEVGNYRMREGLYESEKADGWC